MDGKAVDLNPFLHDIPEHFTLQHAQQCVLFCFRLENEFVSRTFDALKGTSKNWITILGAVLWKSDAFPSTKLLEAFSNFLQIVDPSFRIDVFVSTKMRLLEVTSVILLNATFCDFLGFSKYRVRSTSKPRKSFRDLVQYIAKSGRIQIYGDF